MLYDQFADLCSREFADDGGDVAALELSPERLAAFSADCLAHPQHTTLELDPDAVGEPSTFTCGARVTTAINPTTNTVVAVTGLVKHAQDTAVVKLGPTGEHTRTVTII